MSSTLDQFTGKARQPLNEIDLPAINDAGIIKQLRASAKNISELELETLLFGGYQEVKKPDVFGDEILGYMNTRTRRFFDPETFGRMHAKATAYAEMSKTALEPVGGQMDGTLFDILTLPIGGGLVLPSKGLQKAGQQAAKKVGLRTGARLTGSAATGLSMSAIKGITKSTYDKWVKAAYDDVLNSVFKGAAIASRTPAGQAALKGAEKTSRFGRGFMVGFGRDRVTREIADAKKVIKALDEFQDAGVKAASKAYKEAEAILARTPKTDKVSLDRAMRELSRASKILDRQLKAASDNKVTLEAIKTVTGKRDLAKLSSAFLRKQGVNIKQAKDSFSVATGQAARKAADLFTGAAGKTLKWVSKSPAGVAVQQAAVWVTAIGTLGATAFTFGLENITKVAQGAGEIVKNLTRGDLGEAKSTILKEFTENTFSWIFTVSLLTGVTYSGYRAMLRAKRTRETIQMASELYMMGKEREAERMIKTHWRLNPSKAQKKIMQLEERYVQQMVRAAQQGQKEFASNIAGYRYRKMDRAPTFAGKRATRLSKRFNEK